MDKSFLLIMSIYTITTQPVKLVITSSNMITENVHPSSCTLSKTARVAFDHLWSCVWVGLLWPRPSQLDGGSQHYPTPCTGANVWSNRMV